MMLEWLDKPGDKIQQDLFYCILASNVLYETAKSAWEHLKEKGLLNYPMNREAVIEELSACRYLPRTKGGNYRKYRFPKLRGSQLADAGNRFPPHLLVQMLADAKNAEDARERILKVPGIGMKQASLFLRNIKFSRDLAIIDTHILKFMIEKGVIDKIPKNISRSGYLELERKLKEYFKSFAPEIPLGDVDREIWRIMRHRRTKREKSSTKEEK